MIESLLPIRNFYWADARFQPPPHPESPAGLAMAWAELRGQFSLAFSGPKAKLVLARDPLGSNKLFFAIQDSETLVVANYLIDLVTRGVPFEAVYSVPAGHFLEIDLHKRTLSLQRYFSPAAVTRRPRIGFAGAARNIRRHFELWFARLAEQFRHRRICVCLSGGLDSSLIAALAARCFPDVTAYTYGYIEPGGRESEDVCYARQVADSLGLRFRLVPATSDDVLDVLEDALCYGQDWREFNVHCAIVNEILARAIERDGQQFRSGEPPLVLTGDLSNELLADYTPLSYAGREIYKVPRVNPHDLRTALLEGLDAGDREVGIFGRHGMDVVQPYGLIVDQYLDLPASVIGGEKSKQALVREVAGDLLPSFVLERRKARAQIGDPVGPGGIVSTLLEAGFDARRLKGAFADRFMVQERQSLNKFIWMGRYRFLNGFPQMGANSNGSNDRQHRAST